MTQCAALVIDDDPEILDLVAASLELAGYRVTALAPSADTIQYIQHADYDVLITDLVMPEVDGLQIIHESRKVWPQRPILAMSGGSEQLPAPIGLVIAETYGACRILYKPFSRAELHEALRWMGIHAQI